MIDLWNREISYLRISITDQCNMNCMYCRGEEKDSEKKADSFMSPQEIQRIAQAFIALGINKIRVTGGEPLIRDDVITICRLLGQLTGLKELTMTTNGLLLEKYAAQLKRAGVSRLNLSLDSLERSKFNQITGSWGFERVMAGIEAAKKSGLLPLKINVVLLAGMNENEIRTFAELTRAEQIEIRFIERMPIGAVNQPQKLSFLSGDAVLAQLPELIPDETSGVASLYKLPGGIGRVGIIRPVSRHFCHSCNRIRLTCDGKIKPCLHSEEEISVRTLEGDQLRERIRSAILQKPGTHADFAQGQSSSSRRNMNQIGG